MLSLLEVQEHVLRLSRLIDAPERLLPTYGSSEDGARPHIEVEWWGYYFVVVERGSEIERIPCGTIDELLRQIFQGVTFELAMEYELSHRVPGQDFRRLLFAKRLDLLSVLSSDWRDQEAERLSILLREHPFDDLSDARVTLVKDLRARGHSEAKAWAEACIRYPQPEGTHNDGDRGKSA
jgi:hypothetical protein